MSLNKDLELLITYEKNNVEDQSGNERDGSIVGMTFETDSPLIGSVSGLYDGLGDYLNFGEILGFAADQPWTLAKWFKVSDRAKFQPLIARYHLPSKAGFMLAVGGFGNAGEIMAEFSTNSSNRLVKKSSILVSNDTKQLAMVTYDGSKTIGGLVLYLNNEDAGIGGSLSPGTITDPNYIGTNLRMGARQGDASIHSLDGLGDAGGIWSKVLTTEERGLYYNGGAGWEGHTPLARRGIGRGILRGVGRGL